MMIGETHYKHYGTTHVVDLETSQKVEMKIYKSKSSQFGGVELRAIIIKDNEEILAGYATYHKWGDNLYKGKKYGCKNMRPKTRFYRHYGTGTDKESKVPKIFLSYIKTQYAKYSLVGTSLMQTIYEVSLKDKNGAAGRIQTDSEGDSCGFYHALGFKAQTIPYRISRLENACTPANVDEKLAELRKGPKNSRRIDLGGMFMYLPKSTVEGWKLKPYFKPIIIGK